jgi:hypothetical protein
LIVALTNESTVTTDAELNVIARAVAKQVRYHFAPAWGQNASVVSIPKGQTPPSADIIVHVKDTSDQPGALGYHDDTSVVEAFVFAKTDAQYGALLSVTISHEIVELLADPDCQRGEQWTNGYWYALETGDPVEADADGYVITVKDAAGVSHDVTVSNFILPAWFKAGSPGPYDHGHLLTKPLQVRPGGYVSVWRGTGSWTQYQARKAAFAETAELKAADEKRSGRLFDVVESKSPRQRVRGEL